MGIFSDLLGTLRQTFRVGKATLDTSAVATARTVTVPDAPGATVPSVGASAPTSPYAGQAWIDTSAVVGTYAADVGISPAQFGAADVSVGDVNVTATSLVLATLMPNADHDADDLEDFEVIATPAAGSVVFTLLRPGPIGGNFRIVYQLG